MTNEQKRIKIAEACGWHRLDDKNWTGYNVGNIAWQNIPDYLNDLNAMHEAVASLPTWQQSDWAQHLRAIVMKESTPDMVHPDTLRITDGAFYNATAAQRAEAFGKTLGLWT